MPTVLETLKFYNNVFRNSSGIDISTGNTGEFAVRDNTSVGSNRFYFGGFSQNPAATILQGNTILDSTTTKTIDNRNEGPVVFLDNTIRTLSGVTTGPVVSLGGSPTSDQILIGNTFDIPAAFAISAPEIEYNNTVVTRASLASLTAQTLPPVEPNLHRQIFEVPRGSNAAAIQTIINNAVKVSGTRPVVHFPYAQYLISSTLFIPAASDVQLVGDGYGNQFASMLTWSGTGAGPILSIAGPSKATLKDLTLNGNNTVTNLLITNADQANSRVYLQEFNQIGGQIGLLANQLDHTLVLGHDTEFSGVKKAVSVVGGVHANAGSPDEGRTIIYDGAESNNFLAHQVSNGGNLMVQDSWYEGGSRNIYADLSSNGIFTADGDHITGQQYSDVPSVKINNFSGTATFVANDFTDRFAVSGDGSHAKVLGIGLDAENDPVVSDTSSPAADVRVLLSRARQYDSGPCSCGSYAMTDTGTYDQAFVSSMLTNLQNVHDTELTSLAGTASDVRIFRVMSINGGKGLDIEAGSNILNTSPIVDAGIDQTINLPLTHTTLTGSASDPDGSINSYAWSQISGPVTATIATPSSATTNVSAMTTTGTYVFRLSAMDNGGATTTDDITVIVSPVPDTTPPVISSPSGSGQSGGVASVLWTTNEPASSQVEYGTSATYGTTTSVTDTAPYVLSHIVNLSGLSSCTTYHFAIITKDASNNATTSSDYTFTTVGCTSGGGGGGSSAGYTPAPVTMPSIGDGQGCTATTIYSPSTGQKCPSAAGSGGTSTSAGGTSYIFSKVLRLGMHDPEVAMLQHYLNTHGFPVSLVGIGSIGKETTYCGPATKAALLKYQNAHADVILTPVHLVKPTGIFGTMTINAFNKGI